MVARARAHPFPPIWHPRVVQGGETSLPVQGGHVMVRELRVLASVPVILLFAGILGAILTGILCSHHPNERCCSPGNPRSPPCLPFILTSHPFSSSSLRSHFIVCPALQSYLFSAKSSQLPSTDFDHNKTLPTWSRSTLHSPTWTAVSTISFGVTIGRQFYAHLLMSDFIFPQVFNSLNLSGLGDYTYSSPAFSASSPARPHPSSISASSPRGLDFIVRPFLGHLSSLAPTSALLPQLFCGSEPSQVELDLSLETQSE